MGFVQADPIRAPARAQDLILRHRVCGYRAGDLEKQYKDLHLDEEYFVNYGFMHADHVHLLHPRPLPAQDQKLAAALVAFVRERGEIHPREADAHFKGGRVKRWSGSCAVTTQLLDRLHYGGHLRVVRRENGVRTYSARPTPLSEILGFPPARSAASLMDLLLRIYAPVPAPSLTYMCRLLIYAVPHLASELKAIVTNARARYQHGRAAGTEWFWPIDEDIRDGLDGGDDSVRLLTPFDPIVWDRRRFELCWGWQYRFEAYNPPAQRRFGYYALPILWRDRVVGWGNVSLRGGALSAEFGYVKGTAPRDRVYARQLDTELSCLSWFLGVPERVALTASSRR
jgi:uncharacterized protein